MKDKLQTLLDNLPKELLPYREKIEATERVSYIICPITKFRKTQTTGSSQAVQSQRKDKRTGKRDNTV